MTKIPFPAVLFLFFATTSCEKDSSVDKTNKELLSQGVWKLTKIEDFTGGLYVDGTKACDKDDQIKFNTDHTLNVMYGSLKCGGETDFTYANWSLDASEKIISFIPDYSGGTGVTTIVTLDANTLVTEYVDGFDKVRETYTH
jgi:hypothetical protein